MFYDAISLYDARHSYHVQQDSPVPLTQNEFDRALAQEAGVYHIDEARRQSVFDRYQTNPSTKMVIGDWFPDEFGNPTREIKARD